MLRSYTHAFEFPRTQHSANQTPKRRTQRPSGAQPSSPRGAPTQIASVRMRQGCADAPPNRIARRAADLVSAVRGRREHCFCQRPPQGSPLGSAARRQQNRGRGGLDAAACMASCDCSPSPKAAAPLAPLAAQALLKRSGWMVRMLQQGGAVGRRQQRRQQSVHSHKQAVATPPRAACQPGLG